MRDLSMYSEIIIWGANFPPNTCEGGASTGYAAEMLQNLLDKNGYSQNIIFWVDSNAKLHGKLRLGKLVKSPCEILNHKDALVIINSVSMEAILKTIDLMGIKNDVLLIPYYFYHGTFGNPYSNSLAYDVACMYENEIKGLFDLNDEETNIYLNIILRMRKKNEDDLYTKEYYARTGGNMPYFCDSTISPIGDVTLIDIGAYIGDSIEPVRKYYGDKLKCCMAFEPDEESYLKLNDYVEKNDLKSIVKTYNYALGDKECIISFSQDGEISKMVEDGKIKVEQKVFDEIHKHVIGTAMVKMDIEGAEYSALKGMSRFIQTERPYLAICLYHKEDDIYKIPKFIKSLHPGYRLYIRGGWHLECWAVPEQ